MGAVHIDMGFQVARTTLSIENPTLRRDNMSPKKAAQTSVRRTTGRASQLLTAEERAVMRETLNERRRARSGEADGESDVLGKIAGMPEPDRVMAQRRHVSIKASAP